MIPAITTDQMREVDRAMVEDFGIQLIQMMENAGRALALLTRERLGGSAMGRRILILAGKGNNGGGNMTSLERRLASRLLLFAAATLVVWAGASFPARIIDLQGQVHLRIIGRRSLDHLGRTIAVGDFNGDGWADLAIAADDADPTGNVSGEVYVFFGPSRRWGNIDMATRPPDVEIWGGTDEGRLGHNMTVADLNSDGVDDLIVLDYNAGPPGRHTAGTTHVFFGGTPLWNQQVINMRHASADVTIWGAVNGEHAGTVYAVADLNGDVIDDLVLGAPASYHPTERIANSGALYAVYGRHDLAGVVDLQTDADLTIRGIAPAGFFGSSLAVADLNADAVVDLAVGVKGLDRGDAIDTGAVYIFFSIGEETGVIDLGERAPDAVLWGATGQRVGTALAAGDVNGDGRPDLLVGAPSASPAGRYHAGLAYLVPGPFDTGEVDLPAIAEVAVWGPMARARAGAAVALWDLGDDGLAEMLVNVPAADVEARSEAGWLVVLNGRPSFETPAIDLAVNEPDVVVWGDDEHTTGVWALQGSQDLDNSGRPDLLIGIVDTRPGGRNEAGTVYGVFDIIPSQFTITPSPSASPTPTRTVPPVPSPTVTATWMPLPSSTVTPAPTVTSTATPTPVPTPAAYLPLIARR